ncbi:outer membrane lipid asymmetry maintenance protein MlaD [Frigidibacter sp. ROC022]|uniref:outer membrane lipid asymmetry maintenance protein MlaD n=1 Tax=Frigidibacter sp. ROC022 TaxID=2971796 RepID=UPI00215A97B3|nr:outer membrane lipid asymmetry maintenance protein MlaD [Frigidibacter sp. ROC022]MCR8723206.1 outer membrane lipid asymmetry maintenance protein MlaD [Frigidibacter sp. ROC022]
MAGTLTETVTGGLVLIAAAGFIVYGSKLSGFAGGGASYPLTASFRSVEGVTVGTDVRLAGVKVGTVTDLKLNNETFFADATLSVGADVQLPDDTEARIASEGLLGGSFVELLPGGSLTNYKPGDEIEFTQGSVSLIELLLKYVGGGGSGSDAAEPEPAE